MKEGESDRGEYGVSGGRERWRKGRRREGGREIRAGPAGEQEGGKGRRRDETEGDTKALYNVPWQAWLRTETCQWLLAYLLTCLCCLRRRTRSITNERSPGCSIFRCCHGIAQGQLGVIYDLVGPAEWWTSSWAVPC